MKQWVAAFSIAFAFWGLGFVYFDGNKEKNPSKEFEIEEALIGQEYRQYFYAVECVALAKFFENTIHKLPNFGMTDQSSLAKTSLISFSQTQQAVGLGAELEIDGSSTASHVVAQYILKMNNFSILAEEVANPQRSSDPRRDALAYLKLQALKYEGCLSAAGLVDQK